MTKREKKYSISLTALFSILIFLVLLLLPFRFILSYDRYYEKHFEKDLYEMYGKENVDDAHISVLNYLRYNERLNNEFSQRDKLHMIDVRNIIQFFLHILYSSVLILITGIMLRRREIIKRVIIKWSIYGSSFLILLIAALYLLKDYFNTIFIYFHKIFFFNDYWQMDKGDLLIRLYPVYFWENIFFYLLIISLIFAIIFIVGSMIINRKISNNIKQI